MSYKTLWENNGVCWQLSGIVTAQEILDSNNEFYQDPRSDTCKYQLVDCTRLEKFELDDSTMKELAAMDYAASLSVKKLKIALVGKTSHITDIYQQYINHSDNHETTWTTKMFDNMESARNWLST